MPQACPWYLLNGLTHVQAHLHAVPGMGGQGYGQTRHAVVAVPQDLDPHTLIGLQGKASRGLVGRRLKTRVHTRQPPPHTLQREPDSFLARGFLWGTGHQELLPGLEKGLGTWRALQEEPQSKHQGRQQVLLRMAAGVPLGETAFPSFSLAMLKCVPSSRPRPRHWHTTVSKTDKTPYNVWLTRQWQLEAKLDKIHRHQLVISATEENEGWEGRGSSRRPQKASQKR